MSSSDENPAGDSGSAGSDSGSAGPDSGGAGLQACPDSGSAGLRLCADSGGPARACPLCGRDTSPDAALAALQRDDAQRTVRALRVELSVALREREAMERRLVEHIRETEVALMAARDQVAHMRQSLFWRAREWWMRLRAPRG